MSTFSQIQAFIAVVEERSFTRAAQRLLVTTTAVSKQIKQLEGRFKQQLFARDTRKVEMTEIGEQFYQHCKRVDRELHLAEEYITSQTRNPQGVLRIFSSLWFAETFLQDFIADFHHLYPKIKIRLEVGDHIPPSENFDVLTGFSLLPQIPVNLRYRKLFTTRYVLCASPAYLEIYGAPEKPADLKKHKLLNHALRVPNNIVKFKDGESIYLDEPDIIANSFDFLLKLCCQGLGIFQSTTFSVQHLLQTGKLKIVLPSYPIGETSAYLFYHLVEYEQIKIKCFTDFIDHKIKNHLLDR